MTEQELKARCQALVAVGDEQARATLVLIKELEERRGGIPPASQSQQEKLANALYVIDKMATVVDLARTLRVVTGEVRKIVQSGTSDFSATIEAQRKPVENTEFVGVLHQGRTMDDTIIAKPAASVPDPRRSAENPIREPKSGEEAGVDRAKRIAAIAKAFNIEADSPEAVAAAATRMANSTPASPDARVNAEGNKE